MSADWYTLGDELNNICEYMIDYDYDKLTENSIFYLAKVFLSKNEGLFKKNTDFYVYTHVYESTAGVARYGYRFGEFINFSDIVVYANDWVIDAIFKKYPEVFHNVTTPYVCMPEYTVNAKLICEKYFEISEIEL